MNHGECTEKVIPDTEKGGGRLSLDRHPVQNTERINRNGPRCGTVIYQGPDMLLGLEARTPVDCLHNQHARSRKWICLALAYPKPPNYSKEFPAASP